MNNEELKDLKMVITSGYTISEQYSTRKVESRTSFEIPITVNPILARALEGILLIKDIHDTSVTALESRMIDEEKFQFSMIPTVFKLSQITQEVSQLNTEELTEIEKHYYNYFKLCHANAKKNIVDNDLDSIAQNMLS